MAATFTESRIYTTRPVLRRTPNGSVLDAIQQLLSVEVDEIASPLWHNSMPLEVGASIQLGLPG